MVCSEADIWEPSVAPAQNLMLRRLYAQISQIFAQTSMGSCDVSRLWDAWCPKCDVRKPRNLSPIVARHSEGNEKSYFGQIVEVYA